MTPLELEALDRTISVQIDLLRHSSSVEAKVLILFEKMKEDLIRKLSNKKLTDFSRARTTELLKDTAAVISSYYQRAQGIVNPSLAEVAQIIVKHEPLAVRNLAVTMSKADQVRGFKLVNVDVSKFDAAFAKDADFYIGPNGEGGIGGRYSRVQKFITDNQTFEASSVGVGEKGEVFFTNGRHRYAALRDASNPVIPVAMDEESIAAAKKFGYLVEAANPETIAVLAKAVVPSKNVIQALISTQMIHGAPSAEWWKRQSVDAVFRFSNIVRQGIVQGETNEQIFAKVNQFVDLTGRNSRALVHTSIMQVAGDTRLAVIEANTDIYVGYRHLSTLDGHTTPQCIARSGLKWDLDKNPLGHDIPFQQTPIHWGCRSVILGILKPLTDYGLKPLKGLTRSSAEGQIDRNTSFGAFLGRRTQAQQDEQLGKGRAELWRSGKITLRQLVDNHGNPLTLEQLKAKYVR